MEFAAHSIEGHHKALGVEPGCGVAALKNAWRALASKHHPDRGGDPETFSKLRSMYSATLASETSLEALCKVCGGSGTVLVGGGFSKMPMPCGHCK